MPWFRSAAVAVLVVLVLASGSVAQAAQAELSYVSTTTRSEYLDGFSQSMFDLEQDLASWWSAMTDGSSGAVTVPWWVARGINNFVTNLINEPLTLVSSAVAGDFSNALNSIQRLTINTFAGLGGFIDVAGNMGLPKHHMDLGLAFCVHGLDGGPFLFIPLIGPRTLRDLFFDYVVAYTLYVYIASVLTGPSGSIITFVLAKNALWLAEIATIRQMDVEAMVGSEPMGYDDVRHDYLRRRTNRCQALRSRLYGE